MEAASSIIDAGLKQNSLNNQQRRFSAILVEPKSTLNAIFEELNRRTGFTRNQILLFTFGLIFGCALLGSFIQLIFIALALLWPIHSSIQLLGAQRSTTDSNKQQNEQIRQKLTALLAYWTIFAIQSLVLDHLFGAILRAVFLYWPAKLAFVAILLMGKWEGNNDRLFQTMLTPIGNFLATNMPFKYGSEPKWNANR